MLEFGYTSRSSTAPAMFRAEKRWGSAAQMADSYGKGVVAVAGAGVEVFAEEIYHYLMVMISVFPYRHIYIYIYPMYI